MADVLLSGTVTKKATGVLLISSDDVHNHAQKRDQILYFDAIHCVINEWRGTESENIFQVVCSINYLICKLITVHGFIKIISVNHFGYSIHKLIFFAEIRNFTTKCILVDQYIAYKYIIMYLWNYNYREI